MMLNFTGMIPAPDIEQPPVFVATYSDGFNLKRKDIHAPNRMVAYSIAVVRPPLGCTLTQLRKKKSARSQVGPTLEEKVDVKLTRALASVYANTDVAARFVMDELHAMAQGALA